MAFKHINANEQLLDNSIGTSLLQDGSVTAAKLAFGAISSSNFLVDSNIDFNNFQALQLRIENLNYFPVAGNPGRLIWRTDLLDLFVDVDFTLNIVSTANLSLQVGLITDATHMTVNSTTGITIGDAIIQGGFPFGQVEILETVDATHLVVDDTTGIAVSNVLVQGDVKSIVTAIVDATHLTVANTNGFQPGTSTVSTPYVVSVVQSIVDSTHLVVDTTSGFIGQAIVLVPFGIVSVTDATHLVVDNSTAMSAGDTITQGSFTTTITSVTDLTHIVVVDTTNFTSGLAVVEAPIDVLAVPNSTNLTVSNTNGFGPGEVIQQGTAFTITAIGLPFNVTTVTDATHLVVDSTTGMTPGDTIQQGINSTTITSVDNATHLTVASTLSWVVGPAVDTSVSNHFAVDNSSNMVVGDVVLQGSNITTITSIIDLNNIIVGSSVGFVTGLATALASTTITSVPDATHLIVGNTAGFALNAAKDSTITVDSTTNVHTGMYLNQTPNTTVIIDVIDATHLAVADASGFVPGPVFSGSWVSIAEGANLTGIHSDNNPILHGTVQFLSGTNTHLPQVGQTITVDVPAAGTTGQIQFNDNTFTNDFAADTNLFWDNVNKRLGIGNQAPTTSVDVTGNGHFTNDVTVDTQVVTDIVHGRTANYVVDTANGDLRDANGNNALNWGSRTLLTSTVFPSLNWNNRVLIDTNGATTLDWSTPSLIKTSTLLVQPLTDSATSLLVRNSAATQDVLQVDTTGLGVGIRTAPSGYTLHVNGTTRINNTLVVQTILGDSSLHIAPQADSVNSIRLSDAGGTSNILSIDTLNKRVGINTTTPAEALDVVGNIKVHDNEKVILRDSSEAWMKFDPASGAIMMHTVGQDGVDGDGNLSIVSPNTIYVNANSKYDGSGTYQPYFVMGLPSAGDMEIGVTDTLVVDDLNGAFGIQHSAVLQVESTTRGFLTPRMTTAQRDAIVSPAVGLLIYNTDTSLFNFWTGSTWLPVGSPVGNVGDVQFNAGGGLFGADPNFYWDIANARLGIGNAAPITALDITGDIHVSNQILAEDNVVAYSFKNNPTAGLWTDGTYLIANTGNGLGQFVISSSANNVSYLRYDFTGVDEVYTGWDNTTSKYIAQSRGAISLKTDFAGSGWTWDFDINGDLTAPGNIFLSDNNKLYLGNSNNAWLEYSTADGAITLQSQTGNTQLVAPGSLQLFSNGNNGAGPYFPDMIFDTDGAIEIDVDDAKAHPTVQISPASLSGSTRHPSAILELVSNNQGFLPTRLTTVQRDAIVSPATGLVIYNTDTNDDEKWDGTSWKSIGSLSTAGEKLYLSPIANMYHANSLATIFDYGDGTAYLSSPSGGEFVLIADNAAGATLFLNSNGAVSLSGTEVAIGNTGAGGNFIIPDASAQLDVQSTTKGFLPPRMTTAQRDAIASPAQGLIIFNTDALTLQEYDGTQWRNVAPLFQQDVFDITGPGNVFTLTFTPLPNSQIVFYNGLALANGISEDYTISGNVITLNGSIVLQNGDKILVTYSY